MNYYTSTLGNKETRNLIHIVKDSGFGKSNEHKHFLRRKEINFSFGEITIEELLNDKKLFVSKAIGWYDTDFLLRNIFETEQQLRRVMWDHFAIIEKEKIDVVTYCGFPNIPYSISVLWSSFYLLNGIQFVGGGISNNNQNYLQNVSFAFGKSVRLLFDARVRSESQTEIMMRGYVEIIDYAQKLVIGRTQWCGANRIP